MNERIKKTISLALAFALTVCMAPMGGISGILTGTLFAQAQNYENLVYEIKNGESVIISCDKDTQGEITVPEMLGGCPVTGIEAASFANCCKVAKIILPGSVTAVGDYAFFKCSSLEEIVLPSALETAGDYAFSGCSRLKSIALPDGMDYIGAFAFENCTSLSSFIFPQGPEFVAEGTFFNCTSLISVQISSGVSALGRQAFYRCTSLCDILLPDGLVKIGEGAFGSCLSLYGLYIPETVCSIGDGAFQNCRALTSLALPDNIESVNVSTFEDCLSLRSISIPSGVNDIKEAAFRNCRSLTDITLPDGLTVINKSTFENCGSIAHFNIPQTVTKINDYAFYCCSSLSELTLPQGLVSLGEQAFYGCSDIDEVTVPATLNDYGAGAFAACGGLSEFYTESGNSKYTVYDGALYSLSKSIIVQYPAGKEDDEFTFPQEVTGIKDYAFCGCLKLKTVTMTDFVTSMGQSSFAYCRQLESVRFSESLQTIGYSAFCGCVRLSAVAIPDVMTVYNCAFSDCTGLKVVYVGMNNAVNIYPNAFMGCDVDHIFYSGSSYNTNVIARTIHTGSSLQDFQLVSSSEPDLYSDGMNVYHCCKCDKDITSAVPANDKEIELTFNPQGGNDVLPKTVTYSQRFGVLPRPEKDNYAFLGWFTKPSGGEMVTAQNLVSFTQDTVLYAHWAGKNIFVSFDSGEIPCPYNKKNVRYSGRAGIMPYLEKSGTMFAGWYTSDQHGIKIAAESAVTAADNFTLYAQWAGEDGRVYFDNNYNGSSVNLLEIVTDSLSQGSFDYNFDEQSGVITLNGSLRNSLNICEMPFSLTEGETYIISSETVSGSFSGGCFVLEGFDRVSMSERFFYNVNNSSSKTITVTDAQAQSVSCLRLWIWANTSQYEQAEFDNFSFRLKLERADSPSAAPGDISPNRKTVVNGEEYGTLPVPKARYGYTFAGWFTEKVNGIEITEHTTASVPGEQTLYAHWTPAESDVYFDVNHDGIGMNIFAPDSGVNTVNGLSCSFDPSTDILTFNGEYTEDVILYYKPFKVKEGEVYAMKSEYISGSYSGGLVTFEAMENADNSRFFIDLRNYTYSQTIAVTAQREQNVNCVRLRAWHSSSADVSYLDNFKVRLKFEKISDSAQAPTAYSPAAHKVKYMCGYTSLPVTEREGYNFDGWYTSPQGGTLINEESICETLGDKFLYAHWSKASYYTYFDLNYDSIRPNLFGPGESHGSANGITIDYDKAYGTLTYNGTATATAVVFRQSMTLRKGDILRLTGIYVSGTLTGGTAYTEMYFSQTDYSQVIKFNLPSEGSSTAVWQIPKSGTFNLQVNFYGTGQTADNYKVKLKIEKINSLSDTATAYSPEASFTEYNHQIGCLPQPKRAGYHFGGWYTLPSGGQKISEDYSVKSQNTVYAHWTKYVLNSDAAQIDYENSFIFIADDGLSSLDGLFTLAQDGCSLLIENSGSLVGTGTVVKVIKNGEEYEKYTVIISGDVNSDGFTDGEDAVITDCIIKELFAHPLEIMLLAADADRSGEINAEDVLYMERSGLKFR